MITNLAAGVGTLTSNAFLVAGDRTVLVDAGANFDLVEELQTHAQTLDGIVLTHTHPDHVGNLPSVRESYDVAVWGFDGRADHVDHSIADDDAVVLGDHQYTALHTPGHCDDHLCFYAPTAGILFVGDLVFQNGSFGRTDLPGGNRDSLISSIDRLLATVDPSLDAFHPGHGPSVTDDPYRHLEMARRFAAST